jgi:hypothetical protein
MIRKELPALTKVYNEGMKKEAEEQARKKQPQKETISKNTRKEIRMKRTGKWASRSKGIVTFVSARRCFAA